MKAGRCGLCRQETNTLWQLHLAQYDSLLQVKGKSLSRDLCLDCVNKINRVVSRLAKGTSMGKAFREAGINKKKFGPSSSRERRSFQNNYFNGLRAEKALVEIASLDGNTWRGTIDGFDDYTLLLNKEDGQQELIFKHAMKSVRSLSQKTEGKDKKDKGKDQNQENQEEKAM